MSNELTTQTIDPMLQMIERVALRPECRRVEAREVNRAKRACQ